MRTNFIGLFTSVSCLALLAVSSVESNAQSRPNVSPTAGHCPQGTHPKATFGNSNVVPNPATDCVPNNGKKDEPKKKN